MDKTGTITQNKMTVSKLYTTGFLNAQPSNLEGRLEFSNENGARFDPRHDPHLLQLLKVILFIE